MLLAAWILWVPGCGTATAEEPFRYTGLSLADALKHLQSQGLKIVFSNDLVRPSMRVEKEPRAVQPGAVLEELLAPHKLRIEEGPKGNLIVVRDRKESAKDSAGGDMKAEIPLRMEVKETVIAPSSFELLDREPDAPAFLNRNQIRNIPHFADDFYRVIARLPGAAAGDFSAGVNIRGGDQDEILVLLDGMEIAEPFHLTDFQNLFSIVDPEAVDRADVLTGGFPAEYGNRMSGVIDISTLTPSSSVRTTLGASLLNMHLLNSGSYAEGRGQWILSGRRGYLDLVLPLVDPESGFDPTYYDLLGKLQYQVGDRHLLGVHFLGARDDVRYDEKEENVHSKSQNVYGWFDIGSTWNSRLYSQTILFATGEDRDRVGGVVNRSDLDARVNDQRFSRGFGVRQSWTLSAGRQIWKWGFQFAHARGDYDYRSVAIVSDPILIDAGAPPVRVRNVVTDVSGYDWNAYISDQFNLSEGLTARLGVRWDRQEFSGDDAISPRINLSYRFKDTVLRAGWGRFQQAQRIDEMQVEDGVDRFFPAQVAQQTLVGVEQHLSKNFRLRAEAYWKRINSPRPRFENLFDPVELFPEAEPDRVEIHPERSEAAGVELLIKHDHPRFSWWAGYTLSKSTDLVDGRWIPRSWDQRHAVTFSLNYAPTPRWNFNLAGVYRTGRPTTAVTAAIVIEPDGTETIQARLGPRNAERLSGYQRLDVRASRMVPLSHGEFTFFAEVTNVYNHQNVARIEDFHAVLRPDGTLEVVPEESYWLPWIPSFGISWEF